MMYFKTDGIRLFNEKITDDLIYKVACGMNSLNVKKVIVGYDTRYSSIDISKKLCEYLLNIGFKVYLLDLTTTPALMFYTKKMKCAGIMITASHNNYLYNGFKIIKNGSKLEDNELIIYEKYMDIVKDNNKKKYKKVKRINLKKYFRHLHMKKSKSKIVFDLANGSMVVCYKIIKKYFKNSIIINSRYNGFNINKNCGSESLDGLILSMKNNNAALGVSFDGDGDRLKIINSNFEVLNGEKIMTYYALCNRSKIKSVCVSKITNLGIINYLKKNDIKVIITPVGDSYISREIENKNAFIGAEKSGHLVLDHRYNYSDGLYNFNLVFKLFKRYNYNNIMDNLVLYNEVNFNFEVDEEKKIDIEKILNQLGYYYILRRSGTEELYRLTIMSKEEMKLSKIEDIIKKRL